jgi:hypothetical protein
VPIVGIPAIRPGATLPSLELETRRLQLRRLDGTDVLPFTGGEFYAMPQITGLNLPPRELVREEMPGMDGSRLLEARTKEREVSLPLWLSSSSSHLQYLDRRDDLAEALGYFDTDLELHEGTFDLVAMSARGTRFLRCAYLDGWEGNQAWENAGVRWESMALKLLAVRPFWRGARWSTPAIYTPRGSSWFGHFPGELGSGRVLGKNIPVDVLGNAPSWAQVDLRGPATSVTVTAGSGLSVSIPAGLAAGELCRIVSDPRGRTVTFGGVRNWARVGPVTRWQPLRVGRQTINIEIAGSIAGETGTRAQVS